MLRAWTELMLLVLLILLPLLLPLLPPSPSRSLEHHLVRKREREREGERESGACLTGSRARAGPTRSREWRANSELPGDCVLRPNSECISQ